MTGVLLFTAATACSVALVWLLDRMVASHLAAAAQEAWDRHVETALTQVDDLAACEAIWEASR